MLWPRYTFPKEVSHLNAMCISDKWVRIGENPNKHNLTHPHTCGHTTFLASTIFPVPLSSTDHALKNQHLQAPHLPTQLGFVENNWLLPVRCQVGHTTAWLGRKKGGGGLYFVRSDWNLYSCVACFVLFCFVDSKLDFGCWFGWVRAFWSRAPYGVCKMGQWTWNLNFNSIWRTEYLPLSLCSVQYILDVRWRIWVPDCPNAQFWDVHFRPSRHGRDSGETCRPIGTMYSVLLRLWTLGCS